MFGHKLKSFHFGHSKFTFFFPASVYHVVQFLFPNNNNNNNKRGPPSAHKILRNRSKMLSPVSLQQMINWADGISLRGNSICMEIHDIVWLREEILMSRPYHRIRSMFPLWKRWQRETSSTSLAICHFIYTQRNQLFVVDSFRLPFVHTEKKSLMSMKRVDRLQSWILVADEKCR